MHTLFYKFHSRLFKIASGFAERCRIIISGIQNFNSTSSASSDASYAVKKIPLKQELNKQQKVLLPFVFVLREQQKKLTELSGATEDAFLSLGIRLQDFSSRAKSQSEESAHIAKLFDKTREGNPLDLAREVSEETLANFKIFDTEMIGAITKIITITAKIKELFKHKRDFNVIPRTLRVLAINIKIQGAQIKEGNDNSVFLADRVSELSVKTNIIMNKLFDCLKTADVSMASISGKIDQHVQKFRGQVEQTENRINNALGRLKDMFDLSTGLSLNIASCSSEISKRVGEVVMSMQFHDISRQKMEHVAEAMEDICRKIEEKAEFDNTCGKHLGAYTSRVSTVQMSQLDLIAHEIEDTEKKMIAALKEISRRTSDQSKEISRTSGAGETESDDSIIVQFTSEISAVISFLSENAEINRHILEEVKAVSKTVKEISSFTRDVENIAEAIKILALNAQIEAKHIGKSGLALDVLAREIRDISAESNLIVGEISTCIEAILETADGLQARIESVFTESIKDAENLKQRAAEAKNGLNGLNRELMEYIAELNKKSKKLALDISTLTSKIRFSRKVVERIGHIKDTMQELVETAGPYQIETEAVLDGLNDRYTMESERIAHENAFHSIPMEAGDRTNPQAESLLCGDDSVDGFHQDTEADGVELFEDFDVPDEKKKDDDDLGDNIELF